MSISPALTVCRSHSLLLCIGIRLPFHASLASGLRSTFFPCFLTSFYSSWMCRCQLHLFSSISPRWHEGCVQSTLPASAFKSSASNTLPSLSWSDATDARGRCAHQPGQFRCQHGLLLFDCGLLSGLTTVVSDHYIFRFPRSDFWLYRDSWCHCWPCSKRSPRHNEG